MSLGKSKETIKILLVVLKVFNCQGCLYVNAYSNSGCGVYIVSENKSDNIFSAYILSSEDIRTIISLSLPLLLGR